MHPTALLNGQRFFDTYAPQLGAARAVDIGAQDVNGSLRSVCPPSIHYTGVDFVAGKGIDVVLTDPYRLPFDDASFDVALSTSCFEHSQMFWLLFLEILRVLKPSGLFYLNAPSNGAFHRYPVDCWRFYPDSGQALVQWSRRNGGNPLVLESFTSDQYRDIWNDFVCIFVKDANYAERYPQRIIHSIKQYSNGFLPPMMPEGPLLNPRARPQDQRFTGWRWHKRIASGIDRLRKFR